jgi:hypothetical protein
MPAIGVNCVMCGVDLTPPEGAHTRRDCEVCGRGLYKLPTDTGLKVETGESVVLPAGAIRIGLHPGGGVGQLTYHGMSWFVRSLLGNSAADEKDQILDSLKLTEEHASYVVENSPLVEGFDLSTTEGANAAIDALREDESSIEWQAFLKGAFASIAKGAIEDGDPVLSAFAAQRSMLAHAGLVFDRDLKPLVWRGYGSVGADQLGEALAYWESHRACEEGEEFWQQALRTRPFLLNQLLAAPVVVEEGKAYVGGKGISNTGGNIVDFLLKQPVLGNVVLLEIKTPSTELLRKTPYRDNVYAPSFELSGGVTQLATYRQSLLNDYHRIREERPINAFNPRCVLLLGNGERELDEKYRRESFELFRNTVRDVDVVTYDELFARAAALRDLLISPEPASTPESGTEA